MDKFFDKIKGCNFDFLGKLIEFSNSDTMEKNICEGKETYGARLRNLLSPCNNLKSMIENFGEKKDVFIKFMTKSIDDYINNGKDFDNFCNKVKNLK